MVDHSKHCQVYEADVQFFEWCERIVAYRVQDHFLLSRLFDAKVVVVALLEDVAGNLGCLGVRAWVDRYTVFPCCVAVYESVFRLRDCAGKVAILLALFVMVGFCDREYPTELIF